MNYIKKYYKYILVIFIFIFLTFFEIPSYYVNMPGGITPLQEKINLTNKNIKGSFNSVYVSEYNATPMLLIASLFNNNWDIIKLEDIHLEEETKEEYNNRDKKYLEEAVSNAIYVSYKKANKHIEIINKNIEITYIFKESKSNLNIGDKIVSIDGNSFNSQEELKKYIKSKNVGDKLNIIVKNNEVLKEKYAYIIEEDKEKIIGITLSIINEYKTKPVIEVKTEDNEYGSSGGLALSLSIYNALTNEDITNGKKIVVTGEIDYDGNVSAVGGIKYKLKSANKEDSDLFIVPSDNLEEVLKYKKEKGYNIKVIGVKTFDEALKYLKKQ